MTAMATGRGGRVRVALWGLAALLLAAPMVAMRFTDEVRWSPADFAVFAAMLGAAGLAGEGLARAGSGLAWRLGAAVAIGTAFLLIWVSLAVGIIGSEGEPANLLYAALLVVAGGIAAAGRFRPVAMARAGLAAAGIQAATGGLALIAGWGAGAAAWPRDVIGATAVFTLLWLVAAALFRRAAQARS